MLQLLWFTFICMLLPWCCVHSVSLHVCACVCLEWTYRLSQRKKFTVGRNTKITGEEERNDVSLDFIGPILCFLYSCDYSTRRVGSLRVTYIHVTRFRRHHSGSFFNELHHMNKGLLSFALKKSALSAFKTHLFFPPEFRKRPQRDTGEWWRGPDKSLDFQLRNRRKRNEDSSKQILRESPRALAPLDPDDTFLIGPSEDC